MKSKKIIIAAPVIDELAQSEAEIFGSVVWLWMNSKSQSDMPLNALALWLLPALQFKQFVLAYETNGLHVKPVAYMAWAQLSAEAESRYVNNAALGLRLNDWQSGERFWITDFCAPYGHASDFAQVLAATLPEFCFRSLYHRGAERGMRVHYFRGKHVPLEQAKQWWSERPILAHKRTELKDEVV